MNTQALPYRWLAGLTTAFFLSWAISASAQTTQHSGSIVSHADFYGSGTVCSQRLSSLGEMGTGFDYRDAAKTDWKGSIKWRFLKRVGKSDVYQVEWKYQPKRGGSTCKTEELTFDGVTPTKLVVNQQWVISIEPEQKLDNDNKMTLVATVFGEPLYLEQLTPAEADKQRQGLPPREFAAWLRGYQAARLYDQVWAAVLLKYGEREKLEITEKEAAEIAKSVERRSRLEEKPSEGTALTPEALKGVSIAWTRASHLDWKVCKSLYEKYGGRVGMGSLGAWTALDGQHALIKEHHKAGDIKFHHADLEEAFWQYSQRENFSDTYPKGERLKWLLAHPPYSWDLSQPVPPQINTPASPPPQKTR